MNTLSVGSLYHPARTSWPECSQFGYRRGQCELVLFLADPSASEIEGARSGPGEIAILVEGPVIFVLYQFAGAIPWSDAPFSIHRVAAEERDLPPVIRSDETRAHLQIILVDAKSGIVRALRLASVSPSFTLALHSAIVRQSAQPYDEAIYNAACERAYGIYPTSEKMAASASARSRLGE